MNWAVQLEVPNLPSIEARVQLIRQNFSFSLLFKKLSTFFFMIKWWFLTITSKWSKCIIRSNEFSFKLRNWTANFEHVRQIPYLNTLLVDLYIWLTKYAIDSCFSILQGPFLRSHWIQCVWWRRKSFRRRMLSVQVLEIGEAFIACW